MISERQQHILHALVEEFIKCGTPIGSQLLHRERDLGISPALIRAELRELMEEGYLEQPHTSGGRVPTDRGLRSFVDAFLHEGEVARSREMRTAFSATERIMQQSLHDMVAALAAHVHALGIGYEYGPVRVHKRGFDELMRQIDTEEKRDVVSVAADVEKLDEQADAFYEVLRESDDVPAVFVGKESPFTGSSGLSVIGELYQGADGSEFALVIVGPKRMNYRKNIALMMAMREKLTK